MPRTLDAKGGPLGRLADAGEHALVQVRSQRLAHANGGGGLALSERRGVDARDDDVVAVRRVLEAVDHLDIHLEGRGSSVAQQWTIRRSAKAGRRLPPTFAMVLP
eukprot:scaffold109_cov252-Pinguiococcus_pyrenoidosus.AAC.65